MSIDVRIGKLAIGYGVVEPEPTPDHCDDCDCCDCDAPLPSLTRWERLWLRARRLFVKPLTMESANRALREAYSSEHFESLYQTSPLYDWIKGHSPADDVKLPRTKGAA